MGLLLVLPLRARINLGVMTTTEYFTTLSNVTPRTLVGRKSYFFAEGQSAYYTTATKKAELIWVKS